MLFTTTGCEVSHEEEIRTAVDGFFTTFETGNVEEAMTYTVGEEDFVDLLFILPNSFSLDYSQFKPAELGDTYDVIIDEYMTYYLSHRVKGFVIESFVEEKDVATVIVNAQEIDIDKAMTPEIESIVLQMVMEYQNNHIDELTTLYYEQGEDAVQQKVMKELSSECLVLLKRCVDEAPTLDIKIEVTVTEVDGNWRVSKIEESFI